ncbi:MAG: AmmeMemoRadiSam system protein B [Anaerolineales bacterium]|nr:AmmeMemoRadiSam system protein B [Anaerolineales bacterium]
MTILDVRPSPIAGTWYEGNPQRLAASVDGYLDRAELPELPGEVIAVIAPHAGHRYSGAVAGYAFAAVRGRTFDLVAVISPMHQSYYEPLLTTAHPAYSTPLGEIPVDKDALAVLDAALKASLGYGLTPVERDREHSLEIELPFLQRALASEFKILPVMVREQSPRVSENLGLALAKVLHGRNALLVASTDLSHFYTQETAKRLDEEMLKQVEFFSPEGVFRSEREDKGYACGLGALAAVLWAARELGADTVKVLHHATSGDVTGDFSSVVGYAAAAVLRTKA